MAIKIFAPKLSLFGLPMAVSMKRLSAAGFDGIEILAMSGIGKQMEKYRALARRYGLAIHLHQPWSRDENPTHWQNHALHAFGILPPSGYRLRDVADPTWPEPIVVYADRFDEARGSSQSWFQTASVFGARRGYRLQFTNFREMIRKQPRPIVFDTQHFLEYSQGAPGVGALTSDPQILMEQLAWGWREFGHLVREIHLNDFDPRLGHTKGRNLFPGTGVAPLAAFCRLVRQSKWEGVVTLEVNPSALFPYRLSRLRALRAAFDKIWGE